MFVLRAKVGERESHFRHLGSDKAPDISGRYLRYTYSNTEGRWTTDLQKAKVYNTVAGAKCNWQASKCEVVEVKVELA